MVYDCATPLRRWRFSVSAMMRLVYDNVTKLLCAGYPEEMASNYLVIVLVFPKWLDIQTAEDNTVTESCTCPTFAETNHLYFIITIDPLRAPRPDGDAIV